MTSDRERKGAIRHETYDERRQRAIASAIPATAALSFGVSLFYAIASWTQSDTWRSVFSPALFVQLTTPLVAWALLTTRLRRDAQLIALSADLIFTAAIVAQLVESGASVSGVALFLSLKMLATALFLPWSDASQYVSSIATVLLYWIGLKVGARGIDTSAGGMHQVLGPLIAAVLSAAGAYGSDRTRRILYEREQDLAQEAYVTSALARIASELIPSVDKTALMERLCQITLETLECDASHLCLYDPTNSDVLLVVASAGYPANQSEALRSIKIARSTFASEVDELIEKTAVQFDLDRLPDPGWRRLTAEMNMNVSLSMALGRGDELIGIHSAILRGAHRSFTNAQERIARGMARIATLALENADLVDQIEQTSRMKSDFVAAISHEVRNPLSIILGYTDLLLAGETGDLGDEQRHSIERIDKSGRELSELLTTTLDLSRIAAGTLDVDLDTVVVDDLIRQVDSETRELRDKPGLRFGWRVDEDLPQLTSDALKLKVILKNLIGNAIKFTEEGSVAVEVSSRDEGVSFAVVDTGIGIAPEAQRRIFEAFQQESGPAKKSGVGLGLYIAQRLVNLLDGRISVESHPGQGSVFSFWIPRTPKTAAAPDGSSASSAA